MHTYEPCLLSRFTETDSESEGESLGVEQLPVDGVGTGQHPVHERVGPADDNLDLAVPFLLGEVGLLGQEGLLRHAAALHPEGDASAVVADELGGLDVPLALSSAPLLDLLAGWPMSTCPDEKIIKCVLFYFVVERRKDRRRIYICDLVVQCHTDSNFDRVGRKQSTNDTCR